MYIQWVPPEIRIGPVCVGIVEANPHVSLTESISQLSHNVAFEPRIHNVVVNLNLLSYDRHLTVI